MYQSVSIPEARHVEVPIFKLNFYLMGMTDVDEGVTVQIGKNIEYLNHEFEGQIKFELGSLRMDHHHAYIPDLHEAHLRSNHTLVDKIIDPVESNEGIHIYLFNTYSIKEGEGAMLGFTPVLSREHKHYSEASPQFDRLYISYPGLLDMTTLVHEMGHFLGLRHPWEMSDISKFNLGLVDHHAERNHMSYHPEVDNFSGEQLESMQYFALTFRSYLIDRVEHHSIAYTSAFGED